MAVALFGVAPRGVGRGVGGAGRRASCSRMFGTLIDVPEAIRDVFPFEAVPALPAESMHLVPVGVVATVTVALVATGLTTLRRRDLG